MSPDDELPDSARSAIAAVGAAGVVATGPVPDDARIVLHFHPELDVAGEPVLRRILERGRYVPQFVTGTSNGGLTAAVGGDRMRWEHLLFAGAHDKVLPIERPVYGAAALDGDPFGPAPRFGSAYLRLRPQVIGRATFAYPDSAFGQSHIGTAEHLAGLAEQARAADGDPLDRYVEAHVHGGVRVPGDVEAVVLDPSFGDADTLAAAAASGLAVERHPGFRARLGDIEAHPDYRGPAIVDLARRVAGGDDVLTPAHLAAARRARLADEQRLKRVWHCIARFGRGA